MFESRNGGADLELYKKALNTLKNGTRYVDGANFEFLNGRLFFNTKRTSDNKKSYFMLEIADLFSYAVLQHLIRESDSLVYKTMKKKLIGYPNNIKGRGLKFIP